MHSNEAGTGGGVCFTTGPGTVVDCAITGNLATFGGGVAVMSAWDVVVERCEISLNTATLSGGGVYVLDAAATISTCEFEGNGTGIHVQGFAQTDVDARWNWWGDPSGPFHPALNPEGLGEPVTDYVDFAPWIGVSEVEEPAGSLLALSVHPNPFTASTSFSLLLPAPTRATVTVHDASGRLVRTLLDGTLPGGPHSLAWDGRDATGAPVAAGVYFAKLDTGLRTCGARTVLVR